MFKASSLIINELVKHGFVTSFSIRKIKCAILFFFLFAEKNERNFCTAKAPNIFWGKKKTIFA